MADDPGPPPEQPSSLPKSPNTRKIVEQDNKKLRNDDSAGVEPGEMVPDRDNPTHSLNSPPGSEETIYGYFSPPMHPVVQDADANQPGPFSPDGLLADERNYDHSSIPVHPIVKDADANIPSPSFSEEFSPPVHPVHVDADPNKHSEDVPLADDPGPPPQQPPSLLKSPKTHKIVEQDNKKLRNDDGAGVEPGEMVPDPENPTHSLNSPPGSEETIYGYFSPPTHPVVQDADANQPGPFSPDGLLADERNCDHSSIPVHPIVKDADANIPSPSFSEEFLPPVQPVNVGNDNNKSNPSSSSGILSPVHDADPNKPNPSPSGGFFPLAHDADPNKPNPSPSGGFLPLAHDADPNKPNPSPSGGLMDDPRNYGIFSPNKTSPSFGGLMDDPRNYGIFSPNKTSPSFGGLMDDPGNFGPSFGGLMDDPRNFSTFSPPMYRVYEDDSPSPSEAPNDDKKLENNEESAVMAWEDAWEEAHSKVKRKGRLPRVRVSDCLKEEEFLLLLFVGGRNPELKFSKFLLSFSKD